jgi:hypothetical protein
MSDNEIRAMIIQERRELRRLEAIEELKDYAEGFIGFCCMIGIGFMLSFLG